MAKKLATHQVEESNTINELQALANEMDASRPKTELSLQKVDSNYLRKEYIDGLLEEADAGLIKSIKKNNNVIAVKAITVYHQMMQENRRDIGMQTDASKHVEKLEA
jgi:hypothetical protein